MAELEILIKTRMEMAGAKQAADALERQIGAAKAGGKEFATMEAQLARMRGAIAASGLSGGFLDRLNEQMREAVPGFARLETGLNAMAAGPLGYVAAGFAAIGAAAKIAKAGLDEYAGAQDYVAKRDAALAQTGQLTEEFRTRLSELADEMKKMSGISEEVWTGVQARLVQFGANQGNIEKYTQAVANLAGIMGGDVQGAATLFSRAMQGSFQMLGRYGIVLDENATKTEKLDQLMRELALRGGGQLEASTKTLNGQYKQLKLSIDDVLKGIGSQISETGIIQKVLTLAGNAAEYWAEKNKVVIPTVEGLKNAAGKTIQSIEGQTKVTKEAADQMDRWKTSMSGAEDEAKKLDDRNKASMSHEDKMDDYEKQIALTNVDAAAKRKNKPITEVQALAAKRLIEENFGRKKFARDQEGLVKSLEGEEGLVSGMTGANQSEFAAVLAQEKKARQVGAYERQKNIVASAQGELEKTRAEIAKQQEIVRHSQAVVGGDVYGKESEAKERIKELEAEASRYSRVIGHESGKLSGLQLPPGAKSFDEESTLARQMDDDLRVRYRARQPKIRDSQHRWEMGMDKLGYDFDEFGAGNAAGSRKTAADIVGIEGGKTTGAPISKAGAAGLLQQPNAELIALVNQFVGGLETNTAGMKAIKEAVNSRLNGLKREVDSLGKELRNTNSRLGNLRTP